MYKHREPSEGNRTATASDESQPRIRVQLAESLGDMNKVWRLRYQIYCVERQSIPPNEAEIDRDMYDNYAVSFMLLLGDELMGTVRLIKDSNLGFLMEEAFTLPSDINRNHLLEASRFIVLPELRGSGASKLLLEAAVEWSREHGYTMWCLAIQERLFSSHVTEGWNMSKLSEIATSYHETVVFPILRYL